MGSPCLRVVAGMGALEHQSPNFRHGLAFRGFHCVVLEHNTKIRV